MSHFVADLHIFPGTNYQFPGTTNVSTPLPAMLSRRDSVDTSCYTDRHAVNSDESNVFMSQQMRDQLKKPEKTEDWLTLLKPGGLLSRVVTKSGAKCESD